MVIYDTNSTNVEVVTYAKKDQTEMIKFISIKQ